MATNFVRCERLIKEYRNLPRKKRTRECDKLVEDLNREIEETATRNKKFRVQLNTVMSQSDGDLYVILQQLEAVLSEESPEMKEQKMSAESSRGETCQDRDRASTSAACGGEPAPTCGLGDIDMTWQDVQDENDEVASLRKSMGATITALQEQLRKKDEEIVKINDRLDILERQNSRLYIGAVVSRLNYYLAPLSIQSLTEEVAEDPNVDPTVEAIVRAAQQEFRNANKKAPLDAFKTVAEKARRDRNEMAHPEEVDVDTIKRACSGRATDLLLLNVLLAFADDKKFPLRSSSDEDEI